MSYTQSSMLDQEKCKRIEEYLVNLQPNMRSSITLSKMAASTQIDINDIGKYVDVLVENHILYPHFGLRCKECGMIYEDFDELSDIETEEQYFCHFCEEQRKVSQQDIIVMFTFKNPNDFFHNGQCISERQDVAALNVEAVDRVNSAAQICNSIDKLIGTIKEMKENDRSERAEEKKKERISNKKKVFIKLLYLLIATTTILIIVINIDDIEKYAVRVQFLLFICSMIGSEAINYILEKTM